MRSTINVSKSASVGASAAVNILFPLALISPAGGSDVLDVSSLSVVVSATAAMSLQALAVAYSNDGATASVAIGTSFSSVPSLAVGLGIAAALYPPPEPPTYDELTLLRGAGQPQVFAPSSMGIIVVATFLGGAAAGIASINVVGLFRARK